MPLISPPVFSGFNAGKIQPLYLFDPLVGNSGGYRCATPEDFTADVSISGATVNVDLNPSFSLTGSPFVKIGNSLNVTGFVYPTGDLATLTAQTSIISNQNTIINRLNGLAITGGSISANSTILNPVAITGNVAVNATIINGLGITGTISTLPKQFSLQNNFTTSGVAQTVFTLTGNTAGFIRNLDTNVLYVKFGTSGNSTSFSDLLFGGSTTGDGKGGFITVDNWIGPVSVSGSSYLAYVLS